MLSRVVETVLIVGAVGDIGVVGAAAGIAIDALPSADIQAQPVELAIHSLSRLAGNR